MPSQKVIDYVQDALNKGFSKKEIAAKLKDAGYSDRQIEEGLEISRKPGTKKIVLVCSIIILLLIITSVFVNFLRNSRLDSKPIFYMSKEEDCSNPLMTSEEYLSCLEANKLSINTSQDCGVLSGETRLVCESLAEADTEICATIGSERYKGVCEFLHVIKQKNIAGCEVFEGDLQLTCERIIKEHPDVINAIGYEFYFRG